MVGELDACRYPDLRKAGALLAVYPAIRLILQELSNREPDAQAPNTDDAREEQWLAMRFAHDEPVSASYDGVAQGEFLDRINRAFDRRG
jgi:hypothetical protein